MDFFRFLLVNDTNFGTGGELVSDICHGREIPGHRALMATSIILLGQKNGHLFGH